MWVLAILLIKDVLNIPLVFKYGQTPSREGHRPVALFKILCSKLTHTSIDCQFAAHIVIVTHVYVLKVVLHASPYDVLDRIKVLNFLRVRQFVSIENQSPLLTCESTVSPALCVD